MLRISETELIINPDNSVYHLGIRPGDAAETIITVGDPDRIDSFLPHFTSIEFDISRREFRTLTGICNAKRLTIISTGIGTDNVDIVLNELDALFNIDFSTRLPKANPIALTIIRLGTSGTIQDDIPIGSFILSKAAIGLDGLLHAYVRESSEAAHWETEITQFANMENHAQRPYFAFADKQLFERFATPDFISGITVTANGFYAPQGRQVRANAKYPQLIDKLATFTKNGERVTNLEMETAGIYGLAEVLGHKALSLNAILANRKLGTFSKNPTAVIDQLILKALEILTAEK